MNLKMDFESLEDTKTPEQQIELDPSVQWLIGLYKRYSSPNFERVGGYPEAHQQLRRMIDGIPVTSKNIQKYVDGLINLPEYLQHDLGILVGVLVDLTMETEIAIDVTELPTLHGFGHCLGWRRVVVAGHLGQMVGGFSKECEFIADSFGYGTGVMSEECIFRGKKFEGFAGDCSNSFFYAEEPFVDYPHKKKGPTYFVNDVEVDYE